MKLHKVDATNWRAIVQNSCKKLRYLKGAAMLASQVYWTFQTVLKQMIVLLQKNTF